MARSGRWRRAVALALAAVLTDGCGDAVWAGYTGTGVLTVSGQPALLSPASVRVVTCPESTVPTRDTGEIAPPGGYSAPRQELTPAYFTIVAIGGACRLEGPSSADGADFAAVLGGICMLDFAEGKRTIRITSASLHRPRGDSVNRDGLVVEVGGDDLRTGSHVLYQFRGQFRGSGADSDTVSAACASPSENRTGGRRDVP